MKKEEGKTRLLHRERMIRIVRNDRERQKRDEGIVKSEILPWIEFNRLLRMTK